MLKRVLIPVNFHERYERIDAMCEGVARLGVQDVVLLHVGSSAHGHEANNRHRMGRIAARVERAGLKTETVVRTGSVQMGIVYTAEERGADFIAFAFKRKSVLRRAIMGSTVKDVIRQADIPVYVHKETPRFRGDDETFRVLYATSLQWSEDIILSYIRDKRFSADEVVLLHVGKRAPDPIVEGKRQERVEAQLRQLRFDCGRTDEDSQQLSVLGTARKQIVRVASRVEADLVLVGKADGPNGATPVLGSTAEEVSYNVGSSVLIIPRGRYIAAAESGGEG